MTLISIVPVAKGVEFLWSAAALQGNLTEIFHASSSWNKDNCWNFYSVRKFHPVTSIPMLLVLFIQVH